MDRNNNYKPYSGVKQLLYETGHLWAVEELFEEWRAMPRVNKHTLYDMLVTRFSTWDLNVNPQDVLTYLQDEITR